MGEGAVVKRWWGKFVVGFICEVCALKTARRERSHGGGARPKVISRGLAQTGRVGEEGTSEQASREECPRHGER